MNRVGAAFLLVILLLGLSQASAQASELSTVGAITNPSMSSNPSGIGNETRGRTMIGAGALVGIPIKSSMIIEIGALYQPHRFIIPADNSLTTDYLTIPVLFRLKATPQLSVGIGASYAIRLGKSSYDNGSGNITNASSNEELKANFSLVASASTTIPINSTIGVLVDARFSLGLSDLNSDSSISDSIQVNSLTVLMGPKFTF